MLTPSAAESKYPRTFPTKEPPHFDLHSSFILTYPLSIKISSSREGAIIKLIIMMIFFSKFAETERLGVYVCEREKDLKTTPPGQNGKMGEDGSKSFLNPGLFYLLFFFFFDTLVTIR